MISDENYAKAIARLDYDAQIADAAERVKYQVAFVDRGLQGLMLINGGALLALFTVISGKVLIHPDAHLLWWAFGFFALGLSLALLANLGAFLSQGMLYMTSTYQAWDAQRAMGGFPAERADRIATAYQLALYAQYASIAFAVLALFSFILGCQLALAGVLRS